MGNPLKNGSFSDNSFGWGSRFCVAETDDLREFIGLNKIFKI